MKAQCLRQFLFGSEMHDATDDVEEFWPNEDGECQHFLPFPHHTESDEALDSPGDGEL